jgi:hypothetical protein
MYDATGSRELPTSSEMTVSDPETEHLLNADEPRERLKIHSIISF